MNGLRKYILGLGADLVGFADLKDIPRENRNHLPFGISVGIALNPYVVKRIPVKDVIVEYANEYDRLNHILDEICLAVGEYITHRGFQALPQTVTFVQNQRSANALPGNPGRALLPHKTVAALSGLGWIAKSSLLITPQFGSALRLTSILTDMPIEANRAKYQCKCADCTICVKACPGSVIKNTMWDVSVDRDDLLDFSSCRAVTQSRGEPYGRTSGTCGICVAVCPHTKKNL